MSYEMDRISALTHQLRESDRLLYAIRNLNNNFGEISKLTDQLELFNQNVLVLIRLATAIERQNELLEQNYEQSKPKTRSLAKDDMVFHVTVSDKKSE